jgi:hypothetical protein
VALFYIIFAIGGWQTIFNRSAEQARKAKRRLAMRGRKPLNAQ